MKNIFLLDADETLLDFRRGEREQLKKALAYFGVDADGDMTARFHEINDGLWKKLERGETTRKRLVVERFEIFLREFGIGADARLLSERYFTFMRDSGYLLEGAEEFLKILHGLGRIFIVTNGSKDIQKSRLKKSGVEKYAEGVFISEEVGTDKPSPLFADHVETHIAGYDRARAVWIGDSVTSDMGCAKSRNIDFILFGKRKPADYGGLFAENYGQVLALVESL